ncbi:rhamnogalacturonate lyase precursor [Pyrenophora seminiperda CCB06]|uniref:rhamnogalacturonan endolyase n=1 Tax=Pyrenophora seminiperda CCB06 TaxID=1302712 RepID=A0A3M7MIV7_9PLEO|nr:rhamnogalacturonate lyase precursor [Pyrenophora seminiperda CCB06]
MRLALTATAGLLLVESTSAFLNASQNNQSLTITNDRLVASVSQSRGYVNVLTLDGQNLLGSASGDTGIGPYLDCYCTPSGFWTPGRGKNVQYQLFNGTDSTGTPYGGISMGETYAPTGQRLEQYWFLREGETGLHTFSRIIYHNKTTPFLRNLQEFRTLFRPNHDPPLFTHFVTNDKFAAPRPDTDGEVVVQDATWKLANTDDPYVKGVGDYFTKYTFQDTWRNHRAHGMWADGNQLRDDASQYGLQPSWNSAFYDSIAKHVPNLVTTSDRGTLKASIQLPKGARNPIAILTASGHDFQDNVFSPSAYQYWAEIPLSTNHTIIPRVKAGIYRLTVYADGIFGDYTQDNISIEAGKTTLLNITWTPDSAGEEIFRIGMPDKSSGEYRHGSAPSATYPLLKEEYRLYWAAYDFIDDFPKGITYRVGKDDPSTALNYVHWAVFGGKANVNRPVPVPDHQYNWTIFFDARDKELQDTRTATFTVQLAGAKTAAGNTDVFNSTEKYSNLPLMVHVNGEALAPWVIPYHQSSSCAVRSAIICYNLAHKFTFGSAILKAGENSIVLSLPYNGTDYESALLPESVYVQYDAMRLELK